MGSNDTRVANGTINEAFELENDGKRDLHTNGSYRNGKQVALDNLGYENGADEHDEDIQCGFAFCRPACMQRFANKTYFMIVFSLLAVVQSMGWSYMTGTITTIQKRFKISSQTTGEILFLLRVVNYFTSCQYVNYSCSIQIITVILTRVCTHTCPVNFMFVFLRDHCVRAEVVTT